MKASTNAISYMMLLPVLREIALQHGYALAVHGSMVRDFDIIAFPWVAEPSEPKALVLAIAERVCLVMPLNDIHDGRGVSLGVPEEKPLGRLSWAIPCGKAGGAIDLSVWPVASQPKWVDLGPLLTMRSDWEAERVDPHSGMSFEYACQEFDKALAVTRTK